MIGQYHQCINAKRQVLLAVTNCIPQTVPRRIVCQNSRPPFRDHRKEIRPTRYITAAIIRQNHLQNITTATFVGYALRTVFRTIPVNQTPKRYAVRTLHGYQLNSFGWLSAAPQHNSSKISVGYALRAIFWRVPVIKLPKGTRCVPYAVAFLFISFTHLLAISCSLIKVFIGVIKRNLSRSCLAKNKSSLNSLLIIPKQ